MSSSDETRRAVEAILMVADQPVDPHLLAQVTETPPAVMDALLAEMAAGYEAEGRGFTLVHIAGGYRFQSHPELTAYVERFVLEGQSARLSSAALETLAIVAYKQPISRAQVASIRGVSVDGVMRTLEQRGYIAEIARDPGPGLAVLFGTTPTFLERLGLGSLDDLPPIAEFVPGADVVEALEIGLRADPVMVEPEVPLPSEQGEAVPPVAETGPDTAHVMDVPVAADMPAGPAHPGHATDLEPEFEAEFNRDGGLLGEDDLPEDDLRDDDLPEGDVPDDDVSVELSGDADGLPEDDLAGGADDLPEDDLHGGPDDLPEDDQPEPSLSRDAGAVDPPDDRRG